MAKGEVAQHASGGVQVHRERVVPEHLPGAVLGDQSRLGQARARTTPTATPSSARSSREIAEGLAEFSTDTDTLGDAYEYLIGQFAAGSGKKAGEFYTPQQISTSSPAIVTLDSQEPKTGKRKQLESVFDFACGSGSLLLNVRKRMGPHGIGKILRAGEEHHHLQPRAHEHAAARGEGHGVRDLPRRHADQRLGHAARDEPREEAEVRRRGRQSAVQLPLGADRGDGRGRALQELRAGARSRAADFAFLLHGFHYLKDDGVMAIILPHGVLFRGGAEERIRTQAARGRAHRHRDRPAGEPVLFDRHPGLHPRAEEVQEAGRRAVHQRRRALREGQAAEPTDRRAHRQDHRDLPVPPKKQERYSRRVEMKEIEENDFNLNISRYVSTAEAEAEIDLAATHAELVRIEDDDPRGNDEAQRVSERTWPAPIAVECYGSERRTVGARLSRATARVGPEQSLFSLQKVA